MHDEYFNDKSGWFFVEQVYEHPHLNHQCELFPPWWSWMLTGNAQEIRCQIILLLPLKQCIENFFWKFKLFSEKDGRGPKGRGSQILVICVTLYHITQLFGGIKTQKQFLANKKHLLSKIIIHVIMDTSKLSKFFKNDSLKSWVSMVKETQCENRVKLMVFMKSHHISVSGKK